MSSARHTVAQSTYVVCTWPCVYSTHSTQPEISLLHPSGSPVIGVITGFHCGLFLYIVASSAAQGLLRRGILWLVDLKLRPQSRRRGRGGTEEGLEVGPRGRSATTTFQTLPLPSHHLPKDPTSTMHKQTDASRPPPTTTRTRERW